MYARRFALFVSVVLTAIARVCPLILQDGLSVLHYAGTTHPKKVELLERLLIGPDCRSPDKWSIMKGPHALDIVKPANEGGTGTQLRCCVFVHS